MDKLRLMTMLRAMMAAGLLLLAGCGWMSSTPQHPLQAATWQLAEFDGQVALDGLRPTLTFAADGTVSGSSGCNNFHGPVTLAGPAIHFGALAITRRACTEVVMVQEQRFTEALGRIARWQIDEDAFRDTLILSRESGAPSMRFVER